MFLVLFLDFYQSLMDDLLCFQPFETLFYLIAGEASRGSMTHQRHASAIAVIIAAETAQTCCEHAVQRRRVFFVVQFADCHVNVRLRQTFLSQSCGNR